MATMTAEQARAAFYANAVRRSVAVPGQTVSVGNASTVQNPQGQQLRFVLPQAGIPTHVLILFSGTLSRTDGTTVGTVTASPWFPYGLFGQIGLKDYTGNQRILTTGWDLYVRELLTHVVSIPKGLGTIEDASSALQNLVYTATIPSGTASSTTSATLNFSLLLPISFDAQSVLGSYVATVPEGQVELNITIPNITSGSFPDQSLLQTGGGTTVAVTGTVSVIYYYLDVPAGVPLPLDELRVVHEIVTLRTTQLQAGTFNPYILLTGRTYYRVWSNFVANGSPDTTDVTRLQFVVDQATPTLDEVIAAYLTRIRLEKGRDLPDGVFAWEFLRHPWSPDRYGSLSLVLWLDNTVSLAGNTFWSITRETLYTPTGNLAQATS